MTNLIYPYLKEEEKIGWNWKQSDFKTHDVTDTGVDGGYTLDCVSPNQ